MKQLLFLLMCAITLVSYIKYVDTAYEVNDLVKLDTLYQIDKIIDRVSK